MRFISLEVTLTYFLTLPQVPQPQTCFFYYYLMKINYIIVYWITIIQVKNVCKSSL